MLFDDIIAEPPTKHSLYFYNLETIQALCRASVARAGTDTPVIRTIDIPGGINCPEGLKEKIGRSHPSDACLLTMTLAYLLKSGAPVDPDFAVRTWNLKDGQDYLETDHAADVVIVAHIPRYPIPSFAQKALRGLFMGDEFNNAVSLSPQHSDPAWLDRMQKSEAKIIVTFGGKRDISTRNFSAHPFVDVIPTPDADFADWNNDEIPMTELYGFPLEDLPLRWMGFLAHTGYLRDIRNLLDFDTTFGAFAAMKSDSIEQAGNIPEMSADRSYAFPVVP